MGGGWIGYVYTLIGCGGLFVLVGASTLLLYAVARRRGPGPRVRVTSLTDRADAPEGPDAV
jgi:hypothetical protein